jgi:hypothetical protein
VWENLVGKGYSDLRDGLMQGQLTADAGPLEVAVRKVYSAVMRSAYRVRLESLSSSGVSGTYEERLAERSVQEYQQADLLPFEFGEFADELSSAVRAHCGKERIIAVCDEANRFPVFSQRDILARYLELFASKRVQFLFVAGYRRWDKERNLPEGFETMVELQGLEAKDVPQLLRRYLSPSSVTFSDEAISVLCEFFAGHPRDTIVAAGKALHRAESDGLPLVTPGIAVQAARAVEAEEAERRRQAETSEEMGKRHS